MNDYALGAVETKALFERKKDETFFKKKKTSTSRRFVALTPYEFPAVFLNEFINCRGGMGVGVNDVVCTRTQDTEHKCWVQKRLPIVFKADVCEALSPKGKGVLACQHLLFIGSWSFAAILLNRTKDICTYFVGKEKRN